MSDITKHDSKEEREGDDSEETRVDLLVRTNTVRVDDGLESRRELVGAMEGGRVFVRS